MIMEEKILLRIAWVCVIAGLAGLIGYALVADIDEKEISLIDETPVVIEGTLTKVRNGKTTFATLRPDELQLVAFANLNLTKGERIAAKGRLSMYKDKKELIVERLVKK